ncbi:MAG: hypothetical protein R6V83_04115 [Candidatus Thorarchaeota archaeon]
MKELERIRSEMVRPVHAFSFFSVSTSGEVHEMLTYEYDDPEGYYKGVLRDDDLLRSEAEKLGGNMQYFLDKERVEINGQKVKSVVNYVDIFTKGDTEVVSVVYLIDFAGHLETGLNRIETWIEEETAPYDFEIIWRFPVGTQVVDVDTLLDYEIYNDKIVLWALDGQEVGGYERMEFELPSERFDTTAKSDR